MARHLGTPSVLRCWAVGLAAVAVAVALAGAVLPDLAADVPLTGAPEEQPFDRVVVWIAELALVCSGWWLCLLAVVVAVGAARGARTAHGGPQWWRRCVLAACGVVLVGAATAPAHADGTRPAPRQAQGVLAGWPKPDRTAAMHVSRLVSLATDAARSTPRAPGTDPTRPVTIRRVVVHRGDSLWSIAAATLGPGTPDARIAAAVGRIHAANASTIGDDPDLIFPGQRLWVTTTHPVREESS